METLVWRLGASRPIGTLVELVGWLTLKALHVAGLFLDRLLPDDSMPPAEYVAYRENLSERTKLSPLRGSPPLDVDELAKKNW
jgi:hypothetical protein